MFSPTLGCFRHFLMLPLEPSIWWNVVAEGVRNALSLPIFEVLARVTLAQAAHRCFRS